MKALTIAIFLIVVFTVIPIFAEDIGNVSGDVHSPKGVNVILSEIKPKFEKVITDEVGKKNGVEESQDSFIAHEEEDAENPAEDAGAAGGILDFLNQPVKSITYNKDGMIKSVLYEDGTLVTYSYKVDENGNIKECTMETVSLKIIFTVKDSGDEKPSDTDGWYEYIDSGGAGNIESLNFKSATNLKDKAGTPGKREIVIEIYDDSILQKLKKPSPVNLEGTPGAAIPAKLDSLAKNPVKFDFGAIDKAITMTSSLQVEAFSEYVKNTAGYYEKIEDELRNNKALKASEDLRMRIFVSKIYKDNVSVSEKRNAIDEAVAYIRSRAANENEKNAVREFSDIEHNLRQTILSPERRAYEGKVKDALEHIYAMIDKLLTSKLVLYMNLKKEKIDVVIRLPKTTDKEQATVPQE